MNIKRIIVLSILLMAILSIASASAADNATQDAVQLDDAQDKLASGVEIDLNDGDEFEIGAGDTIDIEFPETDDDLEGELSVSVNGKLAYLEEYDEDSYYIVNNGRGSSVFLDDEGELSIDKLTPGSYNIVVIFTYKYPQHPTTQKSANIIVKASGADDDGDDESYNSDMFSFPTSMVVGENKYLRFDSGTDENGLLVIEADGFPYARVNVIRGKASVPLNRLEDGDITLDVEYYDSEGSLEFEERLEIHVASVKPRLVGGRDITMTYAGGNTYKLTVYGLNGRLAEYDEEIVFKIGKKTFYGYTNSKGVVSFKIPNSIAPGKYKISASYEGATVKNNLVIKHALSLKKAKVKASAKKVVLKATVKKGLKGKVTFKFNGKKFKAKISKKGVAKVTVKEKFLKKLKVGKKVTYQATYIKDTVKRSVKVKK